MSLAALRAAQLKTKADIGRAYGELLVKTWQHAEKVTGPPTADEQQLLDLLSGTDSPAYFSKSAARRFMARADTDKFGPCCSISTKWR